MALSPTRTDYTLNSGERGLDIGVTINITPMTFGKSRLLFKQT